ncbi:trafficking protein particle complex subunit 6b isoform X1 [Carcharodon carcharias]|uniref:trafficking protein particle complex subunit 6b isoform X1 n=1 Tax=Carcharodon carcharias TaxID=13397 RepID=UPI001B7EC4CD|nr:trafficking protein particle complex subunit 6b isoform X1 [Carcharodon carcharias]
MNKQEMADEALFQLLHTEIVSYVYKSAEQGEMESGRCVTKLENMGFRVGQGLIERFTKDTARFKDELDVMKFICKDFWTSVFKKQIDNLRTNHQGIYVLQDNKFRLLTQMSAGKQYLEHAPKGSEAYQHLKLSFANPNTRRFRPTGQKIKTLTKEYLAFTCGLVRGALSNLGIKSIVTVEVTAMPGCKFQVMIQKM